MLMRVYIRPARPDDRPAIEHICAHTWDWGDYIPEVWDDWLAEGDRGGGHALVGEMDGLVVALSKITLQTPDQVWLEGMRVDPDYRQQGIAGQFLKYSLAHAQDLGARVVRLGTSHQNVAVHKMMSRAGMRQIGSYGLRQAEPLPGGPEGRFLTLDHRDQVQAFLARSPVMGHGSGLYSVHWAWQELSAERITQFLAEGQVMAQSGQDGSLAALATVHPDLEEGEMWVGFASGKPAAVTDLAAAIRTYASQLRLGRVQVMIPDLTWLRNAFHAAGYGCGNWEGELWIFERRLVHQPLAGVSAGPEVTPEPAGTRDQSPPHLSAPSTGFDGGTRGR
jgi:GNAT superfamily N-acetyltransferase